MISQFPPPWNFKLTWRVHRDKMISNFPPPCLESRVEVCLGQERPCTCTPSWSPSTPTCCYLMTSSFLFPRELLNPMLVTLPDATPSELHLHFQQRWNLYKSLQFSYIILLNRIGLFCRHKNFSCTDCHNPTSKFHDLFSSFATSPQSLIICLQSFTISPRVWQFVFNVSQYTNFTISPQGYTFCFQSFTISFHGI